MRAKTLEEMFEEVLYYNGVTESGAVAKELMDAYSEWVNGIFPVAFMEVVDLVEKNE